MRIERPPTSTPWLCNVEKPRSDPSARLYWFLITKGYKTYLLLSRNFPEHWPRRERPIPRSTQQLIDCLAQQKFGPAYHRKRGVIRFEHPSGRLRDGVAPIDPALLEDPDVRFFVARNPGHSSGDELCCLGRIDVNFALSYSVRLVRRLLRNTPVIAARVHQWSLIRAWARFDRAARNPVRAQRHNLRRVIAACADTAYGRHVGLTHPDSIESFQATVPIVTYADIESFRGAG